MSSQPMDPSPLYMSNAALPEMPSSPPTAPRSPGPQPVVPVSPPGGSRKWVWLAVVAVGVGAAYWYWQGQQRETSSAKAVTVRTAIVQSGKVEKTLRLTGVTAALNYSSLIAPSLRGGRSAGGGGNLVSSGGGMSMMSGGRGGGGGSTGGSGGSGGGNGSSGGGASAGSGMAAAGGTASGGQSMDTLASTSSGSARTAAPTTLRSARTASGRAAAPVAAPRASTSSRGSSSGSGLGSTASMLVGSGGGPGGSSGGRGGSEFMLQLQELAKSGAMVKKDEVVAEFDRQYMLQRLDDFQSTVTQSEADYRKQLAELDITRKTYEQQVLTAKNAVDKAELDVRTIPVRSAIESERLRLALEEAKANLKQMQEARKFLDIGEKAQVRSADLELQATKLEFRRSQANADRMVVKAPREGLVVMQSTWRGGDFGPIQQGDQIYPGSLFMQIVDPSSMVVNATVNQSDVQSLRIGQRARIRFDAFPGLELPGRLYLIGAITKAGGMRAQFKKDVVVRFQLERMDPRVIPDLSASADVILEEDAQAVAVAPLEAVQSYEGDGKAFVLVRGAQGQWERRQIEVGLASFTHVAVKAGLKPGDVLAVDKPPSPDQEGRSS
jgi:HlyD family secretion protein